MAASEASTGAAAQAKIKQCILQAIANNIAPDPQLNLPGKKTVVKDGFVYIYLNRAMAADPEKHRHKFAIVTGEPTCVEVIETHVLYIHELAILLDVMF